MRHGTFTIRSHITITVGDTLYFAPTLLAIEKGPRYYRENAGKYCTVLDLDTEGVALWVRFEGGKRKYWIGAGHFIHGYRRSAAAATEATLGTVATDMVEQDGSIGC